MQTIWKSHGKMITCLVLLLTFLPLHSSTTSAQSTAETSVCEYQETRQHVPVNPKTNKPYTPEERNQEPFAGASISKEQIKQCLRAQEPIQNHHIVFEDYRDAWQELTKEKGEYDIPLLIDGGVLHTNSAYNDRDGTGGIGLWVFSDPTITNASRLTEEERRSFRVTQKDVPIVLIHPAIKWIRVFMDSIVGAQKRNTPIIFRNRADFSFATFNNGADFGNVVFNNEVSFTTTTFNNICQFYDTIFIKGANYSSAIFNSHINFIKVHFYNEAAFINTIFNSIAYFDTSIFNSRIHFIYSKFNNSASFNTTTFNGIAYFTSTTFKNEVAFISAIFNNRSSFSDTTFNNRASFISSTFNNEATFNNAIFKDTTDFRGIRAEEKLTFDETTWEGRVDLRGMSVKELRWDSKHKPSEVKGVFDLREATIGAATFNEIRFQDVVDFSRTTFGAYEVGVPLPRSWDFRPFISSTYIKRLGPLSAKPMPVQTLWTMLRHPSPFTRFANNTFEKEADFLHVAFRGSALLINNRFRSTLDLTGAMFPTPDAHLCLSFNRINRLRLELGVLGNPPSISPYDLLIDKPWRSLFTDPLGTSKVRQIAGPADAPKCDVADMTKGNTQKGNTSRQVEKLDDIYKTIGQSFREANNQGGVNEAWYLQKVVEQNQQSPIGYWLSRVFLDMPSRYTVDVWRTVWISLMIMLGFSGVYWWILKRLVRCHHTLQGPEYAPRQRAFRIRLFEPIHRNSIRRTRRINPLWDALALSFRAFTKIGFGTAYPNTWSLKILTHIEWALGVYMLIHFILAVKNNLPFILPFLGVVN
jgi:hypothetical protein